jgi:hypothetical protein
MAREPEQRYATVAELDAALAPFDEPERATLAGTLVTTSQADRKPQGAALSWAARRARPIAVLAGVTLVLACGLGVGVTLALVVAGLSSASHLDTAELVLVGLGSLVALAASGVTTWRALTGAWRSIASVEAITARLVRALVVGLAALGVLELASSAYAALHLLQPASNDPIWAAARVLVALGCGAIAAAMGKLRR